MKPAIHFPSNEDNNVQCLYVHPKLDGSCQLAANWGTDVKLNAIGAAGSCSEKFSLDDKLDVSDFSKFFRRRLIAII